MHSDCIFGFPVVDYPYSCCAYVVCRKLKISSKPHHVLFIGVSAPGIKPDSNGSTHGDSSSYCMESSGGVYAAGQYISRAYLPVSSIIQRDVFKQRDGYAKIDMLFTRDEVVLTLDCSAHTLRLQSPIVDHTISILQQHHNPQQQWVLNVNFMGGECEVKLT